MPSHLDPSTEELFRALARHLASGLSTEQIARDMDIQQGWLEQLLVGEEFKEFFAEEQPEAYAVWAQVREDEEVDMEVHHFLASKVVHNAVRLQQLADSGELKPGEELAVRRDLLKMSGKLKETDAVEVVRLSAQHLAAIHETRKELAEDTEPVH